MKNIVIYKIKKKLLNTQYIFIEKKKYKIKIFSV